MMHIVCFRGLGPRIYITLPIQGIQSRQMRNVRRAYPEIGSPPSLKKHVLKQLACCKFENNVFDNLLLLIYQATAATLTPDDQFYSNLETESQSY